MKPLPNFLIVGAEKAGTTSVANVLANHPEIFMSERKEIRFFSDHNWSKGLNWYQEFFKESEGYKAIGEASPAYTWFPVFKNVPERIDSILGGIKLIYMVRNPIERLISHYRHAIIHHWIPRNTTIEEAVHTLPQLVNCSKYYLQLQQYLQHSKHHQWLIISLEELSINPYDSFVTLFNFLEVNSELKPKLVKENASSQRYYLPPWLHILNSVRPGFGGGVKARAIHFLSERFGEKIPKPELRDDFRKELVEEFLGDIMALSNFCSKDFNEIWGLNEESD